MDWTVLQHIAIALFCTGIGWLCGDIYAGACFGMAIFVGREHAQAEYRWIERFGNGKRANLPVWGAFDYRVWDLGSIFDWLAPVLACAVLLGLYACFA